VLVTGGGGYIGNALCKRLVEEGHQLTVWGRSRPGAVAQAAYSFVSYDLNAPQLPGSLSDIDVIIHLAHAMDDRECLKRNETATEALRDAARAFDGLVFVYVSSQSARIDAPSPYGRIKWRIEQLMDGANEVVVRPGFIYGGAGKGAFGMLLQVLNKSPVIPVIGWNTQVQPLHRDDLTQAFIQIVETNHRQRLYSIAMVETVAFSLLLKNLARHRLGRRVLTLPVPVSLALAGAALCRMIPGLPTVPRDRILGLTGIVAMDTTASLENLGLVPRDLIAGCRDRPRSSRRALINEGRILLHYIGGEQPSTQLVRRYVRALQALGLSSPVSLPPMSGRWPMIMRVHEPLPGTASPLARRLELAVSIAEASPGGARLFAAYAPALRVVAMARLLLTLGVELILMPVRKWRR